MNSLQVRRGSVATFTLQLLLVNACAGDTRTPSLDASIAEPPTTARPSTKDAGPHPSSASSLDASSDQSTPTTLPEDAAIARFEGGVIEDAGIDPMTSVASTTSELAPDVSSADGSNIDTSTLTDDMTSRDPALTTDTDCEVNATVSVSRAIGTVGILTLETNLTDIKDGYVQFGAAASLDQRATLDSDSKEFRTLLLGLTPSTTYHYRVVLHTSENTCRGATRSFTTSAAPAGVPVPDVEAPLPDAVSPGFVVTSVLTSGLGGDDGYIAIYNHLGEVVWWYEPSIGGVTRAQISWDGKYIYGRDANPNGGAGGKVVRISMDGTTEEQLTIDTGHHDMTVTPTNGVLFLTGGGRDNCSTITHLSPAGELTRFYDLRDAFDDTFKNAAEPCHCNSIDYNLADRSVSVSCLGQNAYVKLTESGELLWVLGGNNGQSQFSGDISWFRQHGHHFVKPNRLVFYNNNGGGDTAAATSVAVELELDLVKRTATRVWQYVGGETSATLGDVQRLPNGNTLITYSNSATIREVNEDLEVVQNWSFDSGVGYSEHRTSLYGSPLRP